MKLIDIWIKFTNLEPEKQGPVIVLLLEGETQDRMRELDAPLISGRDGVNKIIERLNPIYKKEKYNALESFETNKHNSGTLIRHFPTEFENCYHKRKCHDTI